MVLYPSCIKNYILNDPLIDYLQGCPIYSNRKEKKSTYTCYLESKKYKFTQECIAYFKMQYTKEETIDLSLESDLKQKCEKTKAALNNKNISCIIYGGLSKNNYSAIPEVLIRQGKYFYVVEIRFMTCHFCQDSITLRNSDYLWYCKTHLYFINSLLPTPQNIGYLAVRKAGNISYKEHLLTITFNKTIKTKYRLAIEWVTRLEKHKQTWKLNPPSVSELYPNMKVKNEEWMSLKNELAINLKEISLVWNITIKQRQHLHINNIYSWDHPKLFQTLQTKKSFSKTLGIQRQFIYTNTKQGDTKPTINNQINKDILSCKPPVELFVDFETVMDLDENSVNCHVNMTFMIGVIVLEDGKSYYKDFTVSRLTDVQENLMFRRFIDFISRLAIKHKLDIEKVPIYHWSPAEKSFYKTAQQRHKLPSVDFFNWVDIYQIFKREPITLKNAWTFGLKNIAKVLYSQGEIKTTWSMEDSASDGPDAMIRVIKLNEIALQKNIPLKRLEDMFQIITYNYVDCQVLLEILECLRKIVI